MSMMEEDMEKEKIYSRWNLLLLAAGCTIGVGNIWRFPSLAVQYGGGVFLLVYFLLLVIIGIPIIAMEMAIGRASRKSISSAFQELDKEGQHGTIERYVAYAGNFLLLAVYVPVTGWSMYYFFQTVLGTFSSSSVAITGLFQDLTSNVGVLFLLGIIMLALALFCCFVGVKEGVVRVFRILIVLLFLFLIFMAVDGLFQDRRKEALLLYLKPDWKKAMESGIFHLLEDAMNQALFTLGVGVGIMTMLGKHMTKKRTIFGEAVWIAVIDTSASLLTGIAVICICVAYGKEITAGPELVFQTLPHIFHEMSHGRVWGGLLYLVLFCASASSTIVLFENITEMFMDQFHWDRKKSCFVLFGFSVILIAITLICIVIFSVKISSTDGTTALIGVDALLRRWIFPAGAVLVTMGCTMDGVWGFHEFMAEVNQGDGIKMSNRIKGVMQIGIPTVIIFIVIIGWMNL